jgi:hypothetical protein
VGESAKEGILEQGIQKSEEVPAENLATLAKLRIKLVGKEDRKSN